MIGLELIAKLKKIEFKEIAGYLEISPQSVSDWIKGKRKVPAIRAEQLSKLFHVTPELIGKILTEEEKLKLHYELSDFVEITYKKGDLDNDIEGCADEQLELNLEDIENADNTIYTISDLQAKIEEERRKIKIKEADIMISQLREMYDDRKAIDVHPEFQRVFRWSDKQKSRFIESILLDVPIPPIFVAEDADRNWDVIDGVQRLSTIFEFLGVLRDDTKKVRKPTVLVGTKVLKELEGKVWDNKFYKHKFSFSSSKVLTNAFLNGTLKIIKLDAESDPKIKYDIFDRLNTGGSKLSDQEIRNCLAIMLNREFYVWLRKLSYNPNFIKCLPLSEKSINEQDDLEYVLRFIVYRNIDRNKVSLSDDIGEIITEEMRNFCINNDLDLWKEKDIFDKTFELLAEATGEDSFKNYYQDGRFKNAVKISNFEIIAVGVANNLSNILEKENPADYLRNKIKALYSDKRYIALQKQKIASQRAVTRFIKLTELGTEYFSE